MLAIDPAAPSGSQTIFRFTIFGRPQQRGSKTPWIPRHKDGTPVQKNGRIVIATMDDNKKSKDWMATVRQAAGDSFKGELLSGPLRLSIAFYFSRPQSHFGSGRNAGVLKPNAPIFHTQTPDLAKLVRCLEDALKGIVWLDDKQVCQYGDIRREWTREQERAVVMIETI